MDGKNKKDRLAGSLEKRVTKVKRVPAPPKKFPGSNWTREEMMKRTSNKMSRKPSPKK